MEVERQLRNLTDLNYLVLRPATVYGLGDKNGLGEMSQDKVTCTCVLALTYAFDYLG